MKPRDYLIFWGLVVGLSFYYYRNIITEFPKYMHAWTQSDHYALAIGFTKNNLDLFHPQTYYLNPQIKPVIKQTEYKGITAADLPVYDYVDAIVMKLLNTRSVAVCRIITLLFALVGLFYLFKLTCALSGNVLPGILITVFTFTCPLYNYFQAGFIPTIPSLGLTWVAFYFYVKFLKENSQKHLLIAIVCLLIASLARMTFLIFLIAFFIHHFLQMFRKKKIGKNIWFFVTAFTIIIAYRFYNIHLQRLYGAAFLGALRPASLKWFTETFMEAYNNWVWHYFTKYHYLLLLILIVISLCGIALKKLSLSSQQKSLFELSGIVFCGCVTFYLLMQSQFNHDYYCLDTFFGLTVFMMAVFLSSINWKNKLIFVPALIISIVFCFYAFPDCDKTLKERRSDGGPNRDMVRAFRTGDAFLNRVGIDKSKKILLLNSFSSNIPFILMDRPGFCVIHWERDQILESLTLPFDYIILVNKYSENVFGSVPELKKLLVPVANSGLFTVYTASWKK